MTSSSVLSFALVLLFGALMINALPSCCAIDQGTYNENMTVLNSTLYVACSNCDSTLTTLGVFPYLITANAAITLICTNCPNITTLGSFPALVSSNSAISLTCTTCPLATLVGGFSALQSNKLPISLTCTTCNDVITFGTFPELTNVQDSITLTCTTCNAVTLLGSFDVLISTCSSIQITCTTCLDIITIGNFPSLNNTCLPIALTCTTCPNLNYNGSFPLTTPTPTATANATVTSTSTATAAVISTSTSTSTSVRTPTPTPTTTPVPIYTETLYYSSSTCAGSPVFTGFSIGASCSPTSCTAAGSYYAVSSCQTTQPSPAIPGTYFLEFVYSNSAANCTSTPISGQLFPANTGVCFSIPVLNYNSTKLICSSNGFATAEVYADDACATSSTELPSGLCLANNGGYTIAECLTINPATAAPTTVPSPTTSVASMLAPVSILMTGSLVSLLAVLF